MRCKCDQVIKFSDKNVEKHYYELAQNLIDEHLPGIKDWLWERLSNTTKDIIIKNLVEALVHETMKTVHNNKEKNEYL